MPTNLEIFLKLDGINGESTAKGHKKEIDVVSYEQAIDVTVFHAGGGGSSTGKPTFSGVRFRKMVDAASIPMVLACAMGKHLKQAQFTFRRVASGFDFYKVTLDDVLITHIAQIAGIGETFPLSFNALNAGASADGFLDEVTFAYGKIHWRYQGPAGATISGGWDVAASKKT